MQVKGRLVITSIFTLFLTALFISPFPGEYRGCANAQMFQIQTLTPQQAAELQKLTPEQQKAIEEELAKTGGVITPDTINALKARPELKGLSPEDIMKGKELLEKKAVATPPATVTPQAPIALPKEALREMEKRIIMEEKERSLFDRTRKIGTYQDISLDLKPFGYDFFRQAAVQLIAEKRDIPVHLKYVVGPGDEVKILLWGRLNAQHNLVVDRDGKITIPQIGPVYVAGMTFEEMSKHLIKQAEQIVGTNIDISMGALRTIPIFVLGDVRRPGNYTISALATITDALILAGGPSEIGSMRKIELRRKDKLVTTFDLYDLFLKGDKSRDVTLQPNDVVFVPVTGPLVGIAGNVKRPAIYEFKDKFDLEHLIDLAGGIVPSAYTQQIQVERIIKNEQKVVMDINDKTLERAKHFFLQDADLVKVFSIVDVDENAVFLSGNVKRPGKYAYSRGIRIKDILRDSEDLLKETHFDYALIKRITPPGKETVYIPFNLGKLLLQDDPANNLELRPKDHIYIFSKWALKDKPFVIVEGEVRGSREAPKETGEPRKKVDLTAIIGRIDAIEESLKRENLYLMAAKVREISEDIRRDGKVITSEIRTLQAELKKIGKDEFADTLKQIEKMLQVRHRLDLSVNMRVKDAILSAGGLTNEAHLEKGEIVRTTGKNEFTTLFFNVEKALADDPRENILLQDEDRIVIHSFWEHSPRRSVFIDGDVAKPGSYIYTEKMTVRDLVFKAGNVLESAYLDDAEITEMPTESGKIQKLKHRNVNLKKALEGDPSHNLVLNPYDRLFVKRIPDWGVVRNVTLTGEIKFPGRYTIKKGERLSSVIERAGGYTDKAYLRGAYFTRERVRKLQQESLEEMALRLERELLSEGAAQISAALSTEEVAAKKVELEQKKKFIDSLRKLKATGRMTIRLTHLRILKGSEYDIELEDGDTLHLPEKNSVVNVVGAVMSQGSYIYSDKLDYENYIEATGGYARYADKDNVFVLKVDGSARKLTGGIIDWNPLRSRWEVTSFGEQVRQIEPGDVIVVPEKIERIAWLREIRDITQILMQMAVTAGITIKMF